MVYHFERESCFFGGITRVFWEKKEGEEEEVEEEEEEEGEEEEEEEEEGKGITW